MEINPKAQVSNTQFPKKSQIYQTGIKGENVEINADNVYIINNNYNQPVYNNYNNPKNHLFNPGVGYINPYFLYFPYFPYFWCYSIPFIPWSVFLYPYIWGW